MFVGAALMEGTTALRRTALGALAGLLVIVAACSGGSDVAQNLSVNLKADPPTLDPALGVTSESVSVQRQLFRGLLGFDQDLELVASVAEEVPSVENDGISEDGTVYTFEIRDDVRWSDGTAVTADDFVYAITRVLDPMLGSEYARFFFDIDGAAAYAMAMAGENPPDAAGLAALREAVAIRAVSDTTLEITLARPPTTFLYVMALPAAFPVPQDVVEEHGDDWAEAGTLVGNGPFMLEEWTHDTRLVLTAVEDWWGGDVRLDQIEFRMIPDDNAAYAAYQAGELDVVDVPAALLETVLADDDRDGEIVDVADLNTLAFIFNVRQSPFDNRLVRQAFSAALDRETFVDAVMGGVGEPARGWIPSGTPAALPDGEGVTFNAENAAALLAEAGYPDGADFPSVEMIYANVGPNPLRAEYAQEQFRQHLGVEVTLMPLDPQAMGGAIFSGAFDLALFSWTVDYPDPENWLAELFLSEGAFNLSGYSSADFDEVATAALQELDPEQRLALWTEAHAIIVEDVPFLFFLHSERVRLVRSTVEDLVVTPIDAQVPGDNFFAGTYRSE